MSNQVVLHSRAAPDVVLAAIRERAGYWRESEIPETLRAAGLLGVDVHVRGRQFRMRPQDFGRDPPPLEFELVGQVERLSDGTTKVSAHARTWRRYGVATMVVLALGLLLLLTGDQPRTALGVMFVALMLHLWDRKRLSEPRGQNADGVRHLFERLNAAVATAGGVKEAAPSN